MSDLELTPAVIYARFSSSGQREESITGQLRDCKAYADRAGFKIVNTYEDRAKTGTNDNRPAFQQMIKDSARHQFQAVIVWKLDRFSRDKYDAARYKHVLSQNGVKVFSAMEPISATPEGVIMESLLEGMAQYYSMDLSLKVKRGNRESALEHKTLGIKVYGYKRDQTDHYQIDPDTAPIVKRIFEEYASGKRSKDIENELNAEGIRTSTGHVWTNQIIQRVLRNVRYSGVYYYSDVVRDEDGMPAIVSKDLFAKVQEKLDRKRISPASSRDVHYLLTGKIFCGKCGSAMIGESAASHTMKKYYYYTCIKKHKHQCDMYRVKKDEVEKAVVKALSDQVNDEAFLNQLADAVLKHQEEKNADHSELDALNDQLKEVDRKIHNIEKAIEDGLYTPSMKERMEELTAQQDQLDESIRVYKLDKPQLTREDIMYVLHSLSGDPSDPQYAQKLVDIFLNSVYIFDDDTAALAVNFQTSDGQPITIKTALKVKKESSSLIASGAPLATNPNLWIFGSSAVSVIRFGA